MENNVSLSECEIDHQELLRRGARADISTPEILSPDARSTNGGRLPFDSVTICLHWATIFLLLATFVSARLLFLAQDSTSSASLLQIHRSLGVTIWIATGLRFVWRITKAKLPPFPANMTKVHRAIAKLTEYGLYVLLLGQPMTGLGAMLFRGRPFTLFSLHIPQLVIADEALSTAFQLAHEFGAAALGILAAGHAVAALFHYFVLRDDVLQSMVPAITTARRIR